MRHVSVNIIQGSLLKIIIWTKKSRKGRKEWEMYVFIMGSQNFSNFESPYE
jgi:hypothetical protein